MAAAREPRRDDDLTSKKANDWEIFEAVCVASDIASDIASLSATEPSVPLPGQADHYLVRAEGPCGSDRGARSDGTPRIGRACP